MGIKIRNFIKDKESVKTVCILAGVLLLSSVLALVEYGQPYNGNSTFTVVGRTERMKANTNIIDRISGYDYLFVEMESDELGRYVHGTQDEELFTSVRKGDNVSVEYKYSKKLNGDIKDVTITKVNAGE